MHHGFTDWSTSCHPLQQLCLWFHGPGIKWNEYEILPWAFHETHRDAWLMCRSATVTVLGGGGDVAPPLLFTVTKTMTRVRFTYFATHWQHLWWNLLLIAQDFVATHTQMWVRKLAHTHTHTHTNTQTKPPTHNHTSPSFLKLHSITEGFVFVSLRCDACPEIFLILSRRV